MNKSRTTLIALVILLACIAGYTFLFFSIRTTNQEISLTTQEIDELNRRDIERRKNFETTAALGEQISKLDSYFLRQDDVVKFIEEVEAIAAKRGVEIKISSLDVADSSGSGAKKPAKKVATTTDPVIKDQILSVRLEVSGAWQNVINFVSHIENLPYQLSVDQVAVDKSSPVEMFFDDKEIIVEDVWRGVLEVNVLTIE